MLTIWAQSDFSCFYENKKDLLKGHLLYSLAYGFSLSILELTKRNKCSSREKRLAYFPIGSYFFLG